MGNSAQQTPGAIQPVQPALKTNQNKSQQTPGFNTQQSTAEPVIQRPNVSSSTRLGTPGASKNKSQQTPGFNSSQNNPISSNIPLPAADELRQPAMQPAIQPTLQFKAPNRLNQNYTNL